MDGQIQSRTDELFYIHQGRTTQEKEPNQEYMYMESDPMQVWHSCGNHVVAVYCATRQALRALAHYHTAQPYIIDKKETSAQ